MPCWRATGLCEPQSADPSVHLVGEVLDHEHLELADEEAEHGADRDHQQHRRSEVGPCRIASRSASAISLQFCRRGRGVG